MYIEESILKKIAHYLFTYTEIRKKFYNRYRKFYPDIDSSVSIPEFNHIVWQKQINTFNHAKTLSYKSLKDAPNYLENRSQITKMKQINLSKNEFIPDMKNKINFSIFERFNLFLQEKLDRKKKSIKNY